VTDVGAPAGWYPDPVVTGGKRFFDGVTWTEHFVPPAPPMPGSGYPVGIPPWKGASFGRPANGPGALASPGKRLGARALDALVLLPIFAAVGGITFALAAPHFGPIFPKANNNPNAYVPVPGFVWIYVVLFGSLVATGAVMVMYETVATVRYGRTLGKAWLHIRPIRTDGQPLGWGRSFGRITLYVLSGSLSWLGLLDPLWCLWDQNQQCLHDKAVGTLVINDGSDDEIPGGPGTLVSGEASDAARWRPIQSVPTTAPIGTNPYSYAYWASMPAQPRNNGLAIASLVCSIGGFFFLAVPAVLGLILGLVARSQIRQSNGTQTGGGLATAGIIVGIAVIGFWALIIVLSAVSN
jgi:uncharacterized RDD family membrane protein YckC